MKYKTRNKVPYVEQLLQNECGLCCVAMILRYYGSHDTLFSLRENTDVGRDGLQMSQLKKLLTIRGFETKVYRGDAEALNNVKCPAIIYWANNHYVVLEKIDGRKTVIVDPSIGRRRIDKKELEENFSGYVLTAEPGANFKKCEKQGSMWKDMFSNITINKPLFFKILLLSVITYFLTLAIPMGIQFLVDKAASNGSEILYVIPFVSLVFLLAYSLLLFMRGKGLIRLQAAIDVAMMKKTFMHLLKVPYKFFDIRSKGDLIFRLNSLQVIRDLISDRLIQGLIDFGAIAFITGYMLSKSLYLTAVTMVIFLVNVFFILYTRPYIKDANLREITENSKLQAFQVETVYSMLGIKTSGCEEEIYKNWENKYDRFLCKFIDRSKIVNIYSTVLNTIRTAGPIVVLFFGLYRFFHNEVTIGEVFAFYSLAGMFFSLGVSLSNAWNDFLLASSYVERFRDILQTRQEAVPENAVRRKIQGNITIRNFSFSYTKHSEKVLKNVSLDIRSGQKVAIVGPSGSGKTTLSKLILGLYPVDEGEIYYDGINMNEYDKQDLRRQIGIVPQDMYLFNKSILDNIRMNNEDIDLEQVRKAARIAQIADDIEQMPMKYHTMVSEMGLNLSGGQRQRIALARAIVNDPRIIILDEATSSLDSINEKKVSEYFRNKNCTCIVIAHRLSTIIDADMIYVMDNGEIVDCGTHYELMSRRGMYYSLYSAASKIS